MKCFDAKVCPASKGEINNFFASNTCTCRLGYDYLIGKKTENCNKTIRSYLLCFISKNVVRKTTKEEHACGTC